MSRIPHRSLYFVVLLCALIMCIKNGDVAGTSSGGETSTVTGCVRNADGAPQQNVNVFLRLFQYVAPIPFSQYLPTHFYAQTVTDSAGYFHLELIGEGVYSIEIAGEGYGCVTNFQVVSDTTLADLIVLPYGAITGTIPVKSGATYVQVYGLDRIVLVDSATGFFTLPAMPAGNYALRFIGTDSMANPPTSVYGISLKSADTISVTTSLPTPWISTSVGKQTPRGSAVMVNGQFVIAGGGPDIWNTADGFHFVYQTWTGDGEIVAHIPSFDYGREYFSKAGVQFRASLEPSAQNVGMSLEIDNTGQHVAALHFRNMQGDSSSVDAGLNSITAPVWLRLVRSGNVFVGLVSHEGTVWDTVGVDTLVMNPAVFAGLAVTSHDTTGLSTAVFDSVTVR